jgi:hypothetical protein
VGACRPALRVLDQDLGLLALLAPSLGTALPFGVLQVVEE